MAALTPQAVIDAIGPRTKLAAVTHMSNVLGTCGRLWPQFVQARAPRACRFWSMAAKLPCICRLMCRRLAAISMPSRGTSYTARPHPARSISAAPGRPRCAPFMGGGDMIREVTRDGVVYNDPPHKFEAGTPGIVQQIGLWRGH